MFGRSVDRPFGARFVSFGEVCSTLINVCKIAMLVALGAAGMQERQAVAQDTVGFAEYYILGTETDIIESLKPVGAGVPAGDTGANINSRLSLVSSANNVRVYLDEWEDGYDFNPASPNTTADASFSLTEGQVLTLTDANTYVTTSTGVNGGDRLYVTGAPVSMVRTVWPDTPGTFISGNWALYPVQTWASQYTVPVTVYWLAHV